MMREFGSGRSLLTQAANNVKTNNPMMSIEKPPKMAIFSESHAFGPSLRLRGRNLKRMSLRFLLKLAILLSKTLDDRVLLCYCFFLIIVFNYDYLYSQSV